jgi:hypothetical protein
VDDWINGACRVLDGKAAPEHESIALDRLLGDEFQPAESVVLGYSCLRRATPTYLPWSEEFMLRLVVPLTVSPDLALEAPDLADLQSSASEFEPPSLYISRRSFALRPSNFDEYRLPLTNQVSVDGDSGRFTITYSCYRDQTARLRGWDYYRVIWVDHYPQRRMPNT